MIIKKVIKSVFKNIFIYLFFWSTIQGLQLSRSRAFRPYGCITWSVLAIGGHNFLILTQVLLWHKPDVLRSVVWWQSTHCRETFKSAVYQFWYQKAKIPQKITGQILRAQVTVPQQFWLLIPTVVISVFLSVQAYIRQQMCNFVYPYLLRFYTIPEKGCTCSI